MKDQDFELPKPFMTVYDDVDKVEVGCYSEIQVRAAIEADRKRRGDNKTGRNDATQDALSKVAEVFCMDPDELDDPYTVVSAAKDFFANWGLDRKNWDRQRRGEPVNEEELLAAREALIDMGYLWDGDQWVDVDPPSKTAEQAPEWPDFARMEASLQRLKERLVFENGRRKDLEQRLREKRNGW